MDWDINGVSIDSSDLPQFLSLAPSHSSTGYGLES